PARRAWPPRRPRASLRGRRGAHAERRYSPRPPGGGRSGDSRAHERRDVAASKTWPSCGSLYAAKDEPSFDALPTINQNHSRPTLSPVRAARSNVSGKTNEKETIPARQGRRSHPGDQPWPRRFFAEALIAADWPDGRKRHR